MYSSRQAKILSVCLLRDDYITYQEISNELQISSRTVMRELNQIKNSLQKNHLQIHSKKGKGICILGTDEDKQNLIMDIQGTKIDYMDKEERQELLCLELLRTNAIQKLFYYSHKFQVSEATISHDLDDLEPIFKKLQIRLVRRPGFGVGIDASESIRRQAISSIINNTVQHHIMNVDFNRYNIQDVIEQISVTQNSNMTELLDYDILKTILEVFKIHRKELELDSIAKSSYMGLLIHLMIAVSRIREGEQLTEHQEIFNLIDDEQAMKKADLIAQYLSETFNITVEKTERAFIAIHLQSAKTTVINQNTPVEEYNDIIIKMLTIFNDHGYHLLGDYELYQSLAAHLKPALVRLEYQLPIYNPMLSQIKNNFKDIFEVTKKAGQVFKDIYHYDLNDDEVGYLALHFAAAVERDKVKYLRVINVGIVCSSGIGLSALLMARLKRVVDNNVHLIPLSISDINNNQCELLISTFDIEGAIIVTPLLNQNDVINVLKAIEDQRKQQSHTNHYPINYDLIALIDMIRNLINHIQLYILPHSLNKQEIIEVACATVTDNQLLVKQILDREEKGSNVYKTFGFALLHVSTSLIEQCIVHIMKPDNKEFYGKDVESIKIILLMLVPENALMIEKRMMSYISSQLIENPDFYNQLLISDEKGIQKEFNDLLQKWVIKMINEVKDDGTY